jgi:hypothetical protein
MKIRKQLQRQNYIRREPKNDYMKYYRVIRRYVMFRHEIQESDLEMLMFLYSEGLFTYWRFRELSNFNGWNVKKFKKMKDGGWIHMWRDKKGSEYRLYEMTRKGRMVITDMYKKLNYEEEISEMPKNNPIFKKGCFSHKVLAIGIRNFNQEVRKRNGLTYTEY